LIEAVCCNKDDTGCLLGGILSSPHIAW